MIVAPAAAAATTRGRFSAGAGAGSTLPVPWLDLGGVEIDGEAARRR